MTKLSVETLYDNKTATLTYIVSDDVTRDAVIIDPVLNYNENNSTYSYESVEKVMAIVEKKNLNVRMILETHAHADHLTGADELKRRIPNVSVAIGRNITKVQDVFKSNLGLDTLKTDGSQFGILLDDEEIISAGSINIKVLATPGHTPACTSFLIEDKLFTGDSIFMPDQGTGRCDFPLGSADDLYTSIHDKIYALPDDVEIYVGHDYMPGGRDLKFQTTVAQQKQENIHLKGDTSREEFVNFRTKRDSELNAPHLLFQSIQVNVDAGKIPSEGYLKLPVSRR